MHHQKYAQTIWHGRRRDRRKVGSARVMPSLYVTIPVCSLGTIVGILNAVLEDKLKETQNERKSAEGTCMNWVFIFRCWK